MREKNKEKDLKSCREINYISKIGKISLVLFVYGLLCYEFLQQMLMLMPIYRSDYCLFKAIQFNHVQEHAINYPKYRITAG